jgi:uncharacterized protein (TIGR03663 family)
MTDTETPEEKRRGLRGRMRGWWERQDKRELALWAGLIVVALVLRLYELGSRAFHHDESQDAYFSFKALSDGQQLEYNPLLHGPVRFYLNALTFKLLGDSDFTARLTYACFGTLLVSLPFLLRARLGRFAAYAAGVMLAVSPTILYFSRFAREDIELAAVTLAIAIACFRFVSRPSPVTLSLIGALCAVSFGIKESGLVAVGLMAVFFAVAAAVQGLLATRRGERFTDGEVMRAVTAVGWTGWVYALAALLITYVLLFTVFFTNTTCVTAPYKGHPAQETSCLKSVFYGLGYWHAQQEVGRGADSAWLYPSIILGEEWPAVLLAAVGVFFTVRRPTLLRLFLIWMFAATLAFYCWGSERFAWLAVHPLVPLILLSGVGLQGLWEMRSRIGRAIALVPVAACAVYMVVASYSANAVQHSDPRSLLVSTQTSRQVPIIARQVNALIRKAKAEGKPEPGITVDSSQGATFPYAWYFRHDTFGLIDMTTDGYVPDQQILIMTLEGRDKLRPNLKAYAGRRFDFRIWWVKDGINHDAQGKVSVPEFKNWVLHRKPWNPTGGMPEYLYVRTDLGPVPGEAMKSGIPDLK